jgi:hypothetical protein
MGYETDTAGTIVDKRAERVRSSPFETRIIGGNMRISHLGEWYIREADAQADKDTALAERDEAIRENGREIAALTAEIKKLREALEKIIMTGVEEKVFGGMPHYIGRPPADALKDILIVAQDALKEAKDEPMV